MTTQNTSLRIQEKHKYRGINRLTAGDKSRAAEGLFHTVYALRKTDSRLINLQLAAKIPVVRGASGMLGSAVATREETIEETILGSRPHLDGSNSRRWQVHEVGNELEES